MPTSYGRDAATRRSLLSVVSTESDPSVSDHAVQSSGTKAATYNAGGRTSTGRIPRLRPAERRPERPMRRGRLDGTSHRAAVGRRTARRVRAAASD